MAEELETKDTEHLVLRTEGLVKTYGKRTVVNDVSFDVKQGEIVGLLGPNGAGKTTSFYMTTGLVVPNAGRIFLGDLEITKFPVYKRARAGIGYLAQDIQYIVWKLKQKNIGVLITDHNVEETLCITDRAYLLFEGQILFQGKPQELAENEVVRAKYLTNSFVLRLKDFQKIDEEKKAAE